MKKTILMLASCILFAACPAYCSTYYVSPTGNDTTGDGSIGNPWKTIPKAVTAAVAGDTIYLRGGTHIYSTTITIAKDGSAGARYYLFAYPGERPVLDFSAMAESSSNRGIQLNASYWYIKGIDIYKAGDNGMIIEKNLASYNIIELCNFYENRDTGLQLANLAHDNEIINCDSYYNCDAGQGNADGFAPKLTVGSGNYFYGCRAWQNSDDAYDGYLGTADDVTTTYENCWAIKAGYLKDGTQGTGNGNGFKMGGGTNYRHNVTLINCLSISNKAKGFDQNHNVGDMILYNCTAFNNGGYDYSIYEAPATGKVVILTNCISYTGNNNLGAFAVQTTNSWLPPFVVTSADFVSIDPAAVYGPRNADGSLPDIDFMHLATGSDLIDGGTDVGLPYCGAHPDLGCFEYCSGSLPEQATSPNPANGATSVSETQDLSWAAGSGATSHDVYFGTSSPGTFQGNQTDTTFDTGTMVQGITYYWRIDEVNEAGTTIGTVWSFTTVLPPPPGAASSPVPSNGATDVGLTQDLSWTAGSGATSHDVYFGTVASPPFIVNQAGTAYDTGTMAASTTYYWRIDEKNAGGTTTGTVWSFTTQADTTAPMPNPMTWASVPTAAGPTSITMTATTAADDSPPVQYYFECTTDAGKSSGWQTSTTYVASGLTPSTLYSFRVQARDSSLALNVTGWSNTLSATTADSIPTFVAAGTAASGTGNITVPWPTHQAGDVALLFIESTGGQPANLSTPAGFAAVANSPQYTGTGTAGTRITVYWCRATSSSMSSPVVQDPGDHAYGRILTFRNVISTGDPWDVTAGGIKATASITTTFGAVTTTVNNDLIVLAASRDNDSTSTAWSAWTNANLSGLTERADGGTTQGNGGGIGVATGLKATAGDTGSSTATVTSSVDGHMTIALKPEGGCSTPGQASAPNPSNGATSVSITQDLSWTAGSGATSHDVYFGTVNPPPLVSDDQAGTTYDTGTMSPGVLYYWRIDENNACGTTTGTVWNFTTLALPSQATAPSPANSAVNVSLTQDLSWTAGSNATSHDVYFGTTASPPFVVNQTSTTYDTGTMVPGVIYYWRIDEKNASGTTTGTVWNFTTLPLPGPAASPVPSNGATGVSITQDLSWTAGSGATSHDVYFGTTASPPFILNQTGTTYDTGTMASLTTYYWRINEKNASGTTTGTVWSFTTQDTEAPLPNPMEWAIEPNAISSSAITMTAATATDASGVEYYFANLTDPNHDSGWQDSTVYTDTGLTPDTTYSYAVIASDKSANHNETGWSDTADATTFVYDCTSPIISDLDGDCEVDFFDYALLVDAWVDGLAEADLHNDGFLDLLDIAQFATDWLTCNRDPASECWQ